MKNQFTSISFACLASFGLLYCSQSEFKGGQGNSNPGSAASTSPTPGGDSSPSQVAGECVEGEKIKFQFDATIQTCIDEGKLYDFDSKVCTSMPPAEFECTFTNLVTSLAALDLQSEKLEEAKAAGAKLVGCGQSLDKKTIVAQWVSLPQSGQVDCNYTSSGSGITTGCYKNFGSKTLPTLETKASKDQFVLDCMNGKE